MPLPVATSVIISGVKALLRFRSQVDTILSLNEASAGLPFALPPAPTDDAPHQDDMLKYFRSPPGQMVLQLRGQEGDLPLALQDLTASGGPSAAALNRLFALYYEATGVQPKLLGPAAPAASVKQIQGLSTPDQRLAYYIVESQRLSHNPALVRVLLATTDTLLEFAGENANLFIANPQTQALVANLIDEFAGKRNFDDLGAEEIFKSLLGSSVIALANHPPADLADKPALKALFAALADVRNSLGNDAVAKIISVKGFEQLIAAYATEVGKDPAFITQNVLAQQVLTATLTQIGKNFPQIIEDPKALLGVLEVGIGAAAANVATLLQGQLGSQPLLAAVLASVLKQVGTLASSNQLFAEIGSGRIIPDIYKVTLAAIAANPPQFADPTSVDKFVSDLIAGIAGALSQQQLSRLFTTDTLKLLASQSLTVLAANPQFIAGHNQFATKLLAAVFKAGATAVADGLTTDDLIDIAAAAIQASADNVALLNLNDQLAAAITAAGDAIAATDLRQLTGAQARKGLLVAVLKAIAANPAVWGQLQGKSLIQPLVQAILQGVATDPTRLLSGPVLVDAVGRILQAAARQGQQFINQTVKPDDLKKLLTLALGRASQEVGKTMDGENLPRFLERVVAAFLNAPFAPTDAAAASFQQLVAGVLAGLAH